MKNLTTRSLAAAAITGALVVGTAGIAQADDRSSDSSSQREGKTELGAPVEFGGVTLNNESSSSDTQKDSSTDEDGDGTSSSSTRSNDGAQSLSFGSFSFDPSFLQESAEAQREVQRSSDDGDDVSSSVQRESASRTDAQAPATIGGAQGSAEQRDTRSDSTTTRDDGDTDTRSNSSQSENRKDADVKDTTIDPLFGNEQGEKESLVDSILN